MHTSEFVQLGASIKCLALGPFGDSYVARFSFVRNQRNLIVSVSPQRLKGKSGAVPGAEALIGLNGA